MRKNVGEFITSVCTNMQVMRHFLPLESEQSHVVGGEEPFVTCGMNTGIRNV